LKYGSPVRGGKGRAEGKKHGEEDHKRGGGFKGGKKQVLGREKLYVALER